VSGARASLPRATRLRGAAQFTGAFQQRYRSQHFLLLTRPGGSVQGGARLGIVIGRRHIARAVERARLRRNIREAFRVRRHQLGNIDVVVKYRGGSEDRAKARIRSELNELFGQVEA
jgi:ribonuclease P protein component